MTFRFALESDVTQFFFLNKNMCYLENEIKTKRSSLFYFTAIIKAKTEKCDRNIITLYTTSTGTHIRSVFLCFTRSKGA